MSTNNDSSSSIFIITIDQKAQWINYVKQSAEFDFYHSWHYHSIIKSGIPLLYVFSIENDFIAIPLVKRRIFDTNYFDFSSVYGYSGPISNIPFNLIPDYLIERFTQSFLNFIEQENVVSIFSKLHPFYNQTKILQSMGGLFENGKTVTIDLRSSIELQRKKYRKSVLEAIRKCRLLGFKALQSNSSDHIKKFSDLYKENMKRVNASDFYFFDEQYISKLINTDEYCCKLMLILSGDEVICGSVDMFNNGIIQGHVICTDERYLNKSPAKLLVDEISILGRQLGMNYYHLGGGVGLKEDSLYKWKLGFSEMILQNTTWRYIAKQEIYNDLVIKSGNDIHDDIDFFPLYRNQLEKSK